MPFVEMVGRMGAVDPVQIVWAMLKVGATFGVTVTVRLAGNAHKPAVGVKA